MTNTWPVWKLALLIYVFAAGAVAINLFMLSLLLHWLGLPVLSPVQSVLAAIPLGVPATWLTARWVRGLLDEAES